MLFHVGNSWKILNFQLLHCFINWFFVFWISLESTRICELSATPGRNKVNKDKGGAFWRFKYFSSILWPGSKHFCKAHFAINGLNIAGKTTHSKSVHKKPVSEAERGPCNRLLLEMSEFGADVLLLLANFINTLKWLGQAKSLNVFGKKEDEQCVLCSGWRPLEKVKAKGKGCLSLRWEYAAAGTALLCRDTRQPRDHRGKMILKDIMPG